MPTKILTINLSSAQEDLLREILPTEDHEYLQAADPVTACRILAGDQVDMIFTASDLGPGTGKELLSFVRKDFTSARVPVVLFGERVGAEDSYCLALDPEQSEAETQEAVQVFLRDLHQEQDLARPDTNMADSIVTATKEVMNVMLGMDVREGKVKIEHTAPHKADVIANVAVTGHLSGTVTVFLSTRMAKLVSAAMLSQDEGEVGDEQIVDAVGELTNMVAGNIKNHLSTRMALYTMSAPSVVLGKEVRRVSLEKHLCFTVPFTYLEERMLVEFLLLRKGTAIQPVLPGQRRN